MFIIKFIHLPTLQAVIWIPPFFQFHTKKDKLKLNVRAVSNIKLTHFQCSIKHNPLS